MLKKQYYTRTAIFILLILPINLLPFWNYEKTETVQEENGLEKALKKCSGLDKKIAALLIEKETLIQAIDRDVLLQQSLEKIKKIEQRVKESAAYKKILYYKESLILLASLHRYNTAIMQPTLLKGIDLLLPLAKNEKSEQLLLLLLHERVHLLDISDDFLMLHTFNKQIDEIKKKLQEELIVHEELLHTTSDYIEYMREYKTYSTHPLLQNLSTLDERIWSLYLEKEVKLLKQKEYKQYLHQQQKETHKKSLIYYCSDELQKITEGNYQKLNQFLE
jgi:hypothetical protein